MRVWFSTVGFREVDRLGNDAADEAADFGRRRVPPAVIDARRNLSGVCSRWYPVILDLHRFFISISRAVVNHDGRDGTAPDPLVWSAGALPRGVGWFMRFGTRLLCLGHLVFGIWNGFKFLLLPSVLRVLLFGLILVVFWLSGSLLNSLHWPVGDLDLGLVVFPFWNCSFFVSFGLVRGSLWKKLSLVIFVQDVQFQCLLFRLVQALIFGVLVVLLVL